MDEERYLIKINDNFLKSIFPNSYFVTFSINDAIHFSKKYVKVFYDYLCEKYGSERDIKICELITTIKVVEL